MNATNATTTHATMQDELAARIAALRYYDIAALARHVKGGALGLDINRAFAGPGSKVRFAAWVVENIDNAGLLAGLPAMEETAKAYYAKTPKQRAIKTAPAAVPTPQPKPLAPAAPVVIESVPMPAPQPTETSASIADILQRAADAADTMDNAQRAKMLQVVKTEIAHAMASARPLLVTVNNGGAISTTLLGAQHKSFELLLALAAVRKASGTSLNIWLTGPAGSGKTTAAENVAKALSLPFQFTGAVDNEFKLLGFIDASGRCIRTPFREAYEHGGIFLLDEADGCHPAALLALNAALANGHCDFPDGIVKRHPDCVIMAAANTWGSGATHEYVGRNKLDSASLDRFAMLAWDYDEELERNTSGNVEWCRKVQAIRAKVAQHGIKHIVSPRATYDGAALLASGMTEANVLTMLVRKGLTDAQWSQVTSVSRPY